MDSATMVPWFATPSASGGRRFSRAEQLPDGILRSRLKGTIIKHAYGLGCLHYALPSVEVIRGEIGAGPG